MILAKIMIKWHTAVCEAQGSLKGPKLMIKGIKEAQGRLREAQGTEKALKGTTSMLEAGLTPTDSYSPAQLVQSVWWGFSVLTLNKSTCFCQLYTSIAT